MVPEGVFRVLARKRDALARDVEEAERALTVRRQLLEHVEKTIDLLATENEAQSTKAPKRSRGSLSRHILAVLRETGCSMPVEEIVDHYLARTRILLANDSERRALIAAVRRSLQKMRKRGVVLATTGPDRAYFWMINAA